MTERSVYVPPAGDDPLDAIEQALVRALVSIIVRKIQEEVQPCAPAGGSMSAP